MSSQVEWRSWGSTAWDLAASEGSAVQKGTYMLLRLECVIALVIIGRLVQHVHEERALYCQEVALMARTVIHFTPAGSLLTANCERGVVRLDCVPYRWC
jgi:hypothetical protein